MGQHSFLQAVYIRECFSRNGRHANPHQNSAGNMISLASGLSALTFFNALKPPKSNQNCLFFKQIQS
jgi:hypothetical protein